MIVLAANLLGDAFRDVLDPRLQTLIRLALSVAFAFGMAAPAAAQTLTLMKGIDAPHYDAQRTTWRPTSNIVHLFQDALVAPARPGRQDRVAGRKITGAPGRT